MQRLDFKIIARVRSDFPEKFGIPRQATLAESLRATLVFEPEFRDENALRGIEQFSHLWLIWLFSENMEAGWSPTVRPPRLGGNTRLGVFATRSPFRPNPIGLSAVILEGVDWHTNEGAVLRLRGADLMDGTPVLDIKPYIPLADAHPSAREGYTLQTARHRLEVEADAALLLRLPLDKREALLEVLAQDPRPSYQHDPERIYGFGFAGREIRFRVEGARLTVVDIL